MQRNFQHNKTVDSPVPSDEEVWNAIRDLDPDSELRRSDIVAIVVSTLLLALIAVVTFWLNH
jgi:hypothetical protein